MFIKLLLCECDVLDCQTRMKVIGAQDMDIGEEYKEQFPFK